MNTADYTAVLSTYHIYSARERTDWQAPGLVGPPFKHLIDKTEAETSGYINIFNLIPFAFVCTLSVSSAVIMCWLSAVHTEYSL